MGRATGISQAQRAALARLRPIAAELGLHLVGGTAIAVHLQHRRSLDIDLFSLAPGLDLERVRRELVATIRETRILEVSEVVLRAVVDTTPVDIVAYPYAPLQPPTPGPLGMPVASLVDLAAMKLAAIARRGIRRDFWDLHAIIESGATTLELALAAYAEKFGTAEPDLYPVLRSLTYFDDADRETTWPRGLDAAAWSRIKTDLERWVPAKVGTPIARPRRRR